MLLSYEKTDISKFSLYSGAAFWLLFSLIAVLVRGIRWEETYEHALVITRIAQYPEGHPAYIYMRNVFSLQSYLSAALLYLIPSEAVLCGARNVLHLFFSTFPPFLLGALLTRRALWGHVCAVWTLLGVHVFFQSYYPIDPWPTFFGNGQIGMGLALLTLTAFVTGYWRIAWTLCGLLVSIHLGQLPPILLLGGLFILLCLWRGRKQRLVEAAVFLGIGLLPAIFFAIVLRRFHVPLPTEGGYYATGDVHAILSAYTRNYDVHRTIERFNPFMHSAIAIFSMLLLTSAAARCERNRPWRQRPYTGLFIYTVAVAALVYSAMAVHAILGDYTPFLVLGWMPYRLPNHLAVLLIVTTVSLLNSGFFHFKDTTPKDTVPFMALLLLFSLSLPLWKALMPDIYYTRYFAAVEHTAFALVGAAGAFLARQLWTDRPFNWLWYSSACIALIALLCYAQFPAACLLAGAGLATFCYRSKTLNHELVRRSWFYASPCGVVTVLLLVGLVVQQGRQREHLPRSPFQQRVANYLDAQNDPSAMMVTPYWNIEWLARTRHPVLADYQCAHLMSYVPALAPILKKLHLEVFDWPLDKPHTNNLDCWKTRTAAQWGRLGETYSFRYVAAPNRYPLQLPIVFSEGGWTFYAVSPFSESTHTVPRSPSS